MQMKNWNHFFAFAETITSREIVYPDNTGLHTIDCLFSILPPEEGP